MEGKSFHEFYAAMNMTVRNKLFKKRASHRVSYESGLSKTQTYVLVRRNQRKLSYVVKSVSPSMRY